MNKILHLASFLFCFFQLQINAFAQQDLNGKTINKNSSKLIAQSKLQGTPDTWKDVVNGINFSIALKSDGTIWSWGYNAWGQLGDGSFSDKLTPIQAGTDINWAKIAAGLDHALAIKSDSTLWTWGANKFGQLGDNSTLGSAKPTQVGTDKWLSVAAGAYYSIAIKSDSTIWTWGNNSYGQLGNNTNVVSLTPVQIGVFRWTSIAAGTYHTLAIRKDGTLWAWGANQSGGLGDNSYTTRWLPVQVGVGTWKTMAGGGFNTLAIKNDGTLWTWGSNTEGELGNNGFSNSNNPISIGSDNTWISVAAGFHHCSALKSDGSLWTWGENADGQLGDGTNLIKRIPTLITDQQNVVVLGRGCGTSSTSIIKSDLSHICLTGNNGSGQLGDGTTLFKNVFNCNNSICLSLYLPTSNTTFLNKNLPGPGNNIDFQLNCTLVSSLVPSGLKPVSGSVTAKVFIDANVKSVNNQPYVQRHFDIEPATNAATATAKVILYFSQDEFDAFNLVRGAFNSMPTNGADIENFQANLRITQYHGIPIGGNDPGNYSQVDGNAILITPTSVTWDEKNNWWAVSFPVTGFSGFFLSTISRGPLDVSVIRFEAKRTAGIANRLDWSTATEDADTHFEVTKSDNGVSFKTISGINSKGNNSEYNYFDEKPISGTNYYRLKISSGNNKISYSDIAIVRNSGGNVTIGPVPAQNSITIRNSDASLNGSIAIVNDMQGREVLRFTMATIKTLDISNLTSGVYSLRLPNGEVVRLVKQ